MLLLIYVIDKRRKVRTDAGKAELHPDCDCQSHNRQEARYGADK
jgi:hypothetical protein